VISARAIGILEEIALTPQHGAAKGISERVKEGREAVQNAIKELKTEGLVETITMRMDNGKVVRTLRLTDAGNQLLETRTYILLTQLNSNLILNTNSYNYYKRIAGKPADEIYEEGKKMDDWSFGGNAVDPDDLAELKRKEKERKQREYEETRQAKAEARLSSVKDTPVADRTVDQSVYEFGRRVEQHWHIKPWQTARTRFKHAFYNARKFNNTDGEIEEKMMDRFFASIADQKHIDDPEIIWKMFIKKFDRLLLDVKQAEVTPEFWDQQKEISRKQWENF